MTPVGVGWRGCVYLRSLEFEPELNLSACGSVTQRDPRHFAFVKKQDVKSLSPEALHRIFVWENKLYLPSTQVIPRRRPES